MIYIVILRVENTCGEVSAHKTSLPPPLLIEVPVTRPESLFLFVCSGYRFPLFL